MAQSNRIAKDTLSQVIDWDVCNAVCLVHLPFMVNLSNRHKSEQQQLTMVFVTASFRSLQTHQTRSGPDLDMSFLQWKPQSSPIKLCVYFQIKHSLSDALAFDQFAPLDSSKKYLGAVRAVPRSNSMPAQQSLARAQSAIHGGRAVSRSASRGRCVVCDVCAVHFTNDGCIRLSAHTVVHKHLLTYTGLAFT